MLDSVFLSVSGISSVFAMPGDPAILDERPERLVLTAADLLNTAAVKLPPYWPDNIKTWLIQSESQFRLKGVTVSQTKFDHVVQSMSQNDAVKVLDLIPAPPSYDSHGHLKNRLLRMYGLTDYTRFEDISSLPFSGDMLPSALMSKMLSLLPAGHEAYFFLRGAFLKCLSTDVQSHLLHDNTSDPLTLVLHANEIHQSRVSSASTVNHVHSTPDGYSILAIQAPTVSHGCSQHSPTPSPCPCCPSTPPSTSPRSDSPDLCWYHRNHSDKAQKCRAPCSWSGI